MRKLLFICCLGAVLLIIAGCKEEDVSPAVVGPITTVPDIPPEVVQHSFEADPATFHFIADWLTDSKIAYVEKNQGIYTVNSFDLKTGETDTLYEDDAMIIDVLIHPSKKHILLHTSNNPTSANVKIISTDGLVEEEVEVASTELAIEWNDIDPSLILLTAFHQDWTFDLFMYNGNKDFFSLLEIDDPFPKWFGTDSIAIGQVDDHLLDGGDVLTYTPSDGQWRNFGLEGVVYFDTYKDTILTVQINADMEADYSLMGLDGTLRSEWTMPAISNYSEWVIPEVEWTSGDDLFMATADEGGLLDELDTPYRLVRINEAVQTVVADGIEAVPPRCSPSGQLCITGFSSETLIDVDSGKLRNWLTFHDAE